MSRRVLASNTLRPVERNHIQLVQRRGMLHGQRLSLRFASEISRDKFQGKRSTLNIKLPDLEEIETSSAIDPSNVPYVPDLFQSEAKSAEIEANKAKQSVTDGSPTPKVVTAAAESTLPGVSSNIFQKSEELKAFADMQEARTGGALQDATNALKGWTENLKLPGAGTVSPTGSRDPNRTELDQDDIRGLYVLFGIVGGGWLLGGLVAKNGTQPIRHSHDH